MTELSFCSTSSITVGAHVVSHGAAQVEERGESLLIPFGAAGVAPEVGHVAQAGASLNGYSLHDSAGNVTQIYARSSITDPPYAPYPALGRIVVLKDSWSQPTVPVRDFFQRITFQNLLERLDAFSRLQPSWAGPGSEPPAAHSLESVRKLLYHARAQGLMAERLTPASGSVFVRFAGDEATVDLECEADGSITALLKVSGAPAVAWELNPTELTTEVSRIRADLAG